MVLALIAAASAVAAPAGTPATCAPASLSGCASTNDLVWSKAFLRDLGAFLGDARASHLQHDRLVFDQAQAVLGGPPEAPSRLDDGSWLFTACRVHSCPEKGAVVFSAGGQILALGILHFACDNACLAAPRLALYVRHGATIDAARRAVERWAGAADPTLIGVDVMITGTRNRG